MWFPVAFSDTALAVKVRLKGCTASIHLLLQEFIMKAFHARKLISRTTKVSHGLIENSFKIYGKVKEIHFNDLRNTEY